MSIGILVFVSINFLKWFSTVFWTVNGVGTNLNVSFEQPFMLMVPRNLKMIPDLFTDLKGLKIGVWNGIWLKSTRDSYFFNRITPTWNTLLVKIVQALVFLKNMFKIALTTASAAVIYTIGYNGVQICKNNIFLKHGVQNSHRFT